MATRTANHTTTPPFDEDGFLLDPSLWSIKLATRIADQDGLPMLTQAHWDILHGLRGHYLAHGSLPVMEHLCRINRLGHHCVSDLFRHEREAWRLAGLPNPGEEAKTYMI